MLIPELEHDLESFGIIWKFGVESVTALQWEEACEIFFQKLKQILHFHERGGLLVDTREVELEFLENAPLKSIVLVAEDTLGLALFQEHFLDQDVQKFQLQVAERHVPQHLAAC